MMLNASCRKCMNGIFHWPRRAQRTRRNRPKSPKLTMKESAKQKRMPRPAAPRKRMPRHPVPPHSLDRIQMQAEQAQCLSRKDHHLPLLARGNPKLRDPAGATIVITTVPSVNGPSIVDNGGTGTGPAADGSFGADFPNSGL